jgi:effector-binding domain-containing protein
MKILKILLYIFIVLFGIYLVLCFAGTSKFDVERSIDINASAESIFEEISDYNKLAAWSPWSKKDPDMANTITGNAGSVGHKNSWTSKTQGNGEQQIVEIKQDEYIKTELKFADWDGVSIAEMILKPGDNFTKLTWTMKGNEVPFFARGIITIMGVTGELEKDYENGLANLKKVVEAKPKLATIDYELIDVSEMIFIGKRMKINEKQIDSTLFANTYSELTKVAGGESKINGMPFSIGHAYNEKNGDMDLEIGLPIASKIKVAEGLSCGTISAGKCVKHIFKGPYEETSKAWMPLMNEVMTKYKPRFSGYEVYVNDPATIKNKSELITWLMVPIE